MFEEKENLESKEASEKIQSTPLLPEEEIHVMSDYLKRKGPPPVFGKPKKSFPLWLIWVFLGIIFIGFAGAFYLKPEFFLSFFTEKPRPFINQPINQPVVNISKIVNKEEILSPQVSPEETLKGELKRDDEVIVSAELYLPEGALPLGEKLTLDSAFYLEPEEKYKIIGGIFRISPLITPLKPLNLKIYYSQKEVESLWEDDLKIGYLKEGFWIILPTEIDTEKNILSTTISSLYSGTFAPLVLKEKTLPKKELQEIAPGIYLSEDSDNDGLTDKEEEIYKTNKDDPDTDKDGFSDSSEIINLYSPLSAGTKLAETDLIKIYTNQTFGYSLFYPAPFLPREMPESEDREVVISSETGEFFGIVVQDNLEMLPIENWYKKQIKGLETDKLVKTEVDGHEAVWSLDGLTLYIGKGDKIYVFTYNIGGATIANFKSTYQMMIKSFKFLGE